ncbi:uncharacterized protein FIBRA_01689 [Fibroporia radiculosa]|uniref:Uncharacterized protein n=1 Tax=Fibroporia radiculosa TaxID=599839 RepID=J4G146_9APHY|nr:uncharacterized protein FIBRA_01689 [Fibroporia radiculosa]CCL99668.1 predicted protein [Fibroporia radiculosa]
MSRAGVPVKQEPGSNLLKKSTTPARAPASVPKAAAQVFPARRPLSGSEPPAGAPSPAHPNVASGDSLPAPPRTSDAGSDASCASSSASAASRSFVKTSGRRLSLSTPSETALPFGPRAPGTAAPSRKSPTPPPTAGKENVPSWARPTRASAARTTDAAPKAPKVKTRGRALTVVAAPTAVASPDLPAPARDVQELAVGQDACLIVSLTQATREAVVVDAAQTLDQVVIDAAQTLDQDVVDAAQTPAQDVIKEYVGKDEAGAARPEEADRSPPGVEVPAGEKEENESKKDIMEMIPTLPQSSYLTVPEWGYLDTVARTSPAKTSRSVSPVKARTRAQERAVRPLSMRNGASLSDGIVPIRPSVVFKNALEVLAEIGECIEEEIEERELAVPADLHNEEQPGDEVVAEDEEDVSALQRILSSEPSVPDADSVESLDQSPGDIHQGAFGDLLRLLEEALDKPVEDAVWQDVQPCVAPAEDTSKMAALIAALGLGEGETLHEVEAARVVTESSVELCAVDDALEAVVVKEDEDMASLGRLFLGIDEDEFDDDDDDDSYDYEAEGEDENYAYAVTDDSDDESCTSDTSRVEVRRYSKPPTIQSPVEIYSRRHLSKAAKTAGTKQSVTNATFEMPPLVRLAYTVESDEEEDEDAAFFEAVLQYQSTLHTLNPASASRSRGSPTSSPCYKDARTHFPLLNTHSFESHETLFATCDTTDKKLDALHVLTAHDIKTTPDFSAMEGTAEFGVTSSDSSDFTDELCPASSANYDDCPQEASFDAMHVLDALILEEDIVDDSPRLTAAEKGKGREIVNLEEEEEEEEEMEQPVPAPVPVPQPQRLSLVFEEASAGVNHGLSFVYFPIEAPEFIIGDSKGFNARSASGCHSTPPRQRVQAPESRQAGFWTRLLKRNPHNSEASAKKSTNSSFNSLRGTPAISASTSSFYSADASYFSGTSAPSTRTGLSAFSPPKVSPFRSSQKDKPLSAVRGFFRRLF